MKNSAVVWDGLRCIPGVDEFKVCVVRLPGEDIPTWYSVIFPSFCGPQSCLDMCEIRTALSELQLGLLDLTCRHVLGTVSLMLR